MSLSAGTHRFGPDNGTLSVHTKRTGAAAKAGHNLEIVVTAWEGTIEVGDETALSLTADGSSLRVVAGHGGMQKLDDDDKSNITKTIDDEILKRGEIRFASRSVEVGGDGSIAVVGELTLGDKSQEVTFDLDSDSHGAVNATAVVTQSGWGMKPYSILFGSLKVVDEIEVKLEAQL